MATHMYVSLGGEFFILQAKFKSLQLAKKGN